MANYINPFTDIGFKRIFGQGWMTARNMKADEMSIELIQKYSGLSPEEIAKL